jgi:hypothetical protein
LIGFVWLFPVIFSPSFNWKRISVSMNIMKDPTNHYVTAVPANVFDVTNMYLLMSLMLRTIRFRYYPLFPLLFLFLFPLFQVLD